MVPRRLLRVLLFCCVMALVFGISEFLLWLAYPLHPDPRVQYENESLAYRFDENYMIALLPNREKIYPVPKADGGGAVHWKTNSHGFRGEELKPDPDVRWIVYGDSNIHARFSPLEETFAHQLERRLISATGRNVEVINAGITGFGPDQNLIRFAEEREEFHPDGVIFHVFADNDFGDLVRNRLFDWSDAGGLVATTHPRTVDPSLTMFQAGYRSRNLLSASRTWWAVRTALFKGLPLIQGERTGAERIEELLALREEEYAVYREGGPQSYSMLDDDYDMDVALYPGIESSRTKRDLMKAVLVNAHAIATAAGINFVVLIQPSKHDLTENIKPNHRDFEKYPDYRPDNLTRFLAEACEQSGIDFVNLYDAYRDRNTDALYLAEQDAHWNAAGQALAADEVAAYVLLK